MHFKLPMSSAVELGMLDEAQPPISFSIVFRGSSPLVFLKALQERQGRIMHRFCRRDSGYMLTVQAAISFLFAHIQFTAKTTKMKASVTATTTSVDPCSTLVHYLSP